MKRALRDLDRAIRGRLFEITRPSVSVVHIASFSRSGETVLLRSLDAHSRIRVVHQIRRHDRRQDTRLFRHLRSWARPTISRLSPVVQAAGLGAETVLVVKNAVWEHQHPYRGFVLVRNPLAVFRSFGIHCEQEEGRQKRIEQFLRWSRGIDLRLEPGVRNGDNLVSFCAVYNRKMYALARLGLPVVHYERFVRDPRRTLGKIIAHLGLQWEEAVATAHESYEEGEIGHGGIKLWLPIHAGSLDRHKSLPEAVRSQIFGLTYPVLEAFGYNVDGDEVSIRDDFDDGFGPRRFGTRPVLLRSSSK